MKIVRNQGLWRKYNSIVFPSKTLVRNHESWFFDSLSVYFDDVVYEWSQTSTGNGNDVNFAVVSTHSPGFESKFQCGVCANDVQQRVVDWCQCCKFVLKLSYSWEVLQSSCCRFKENCYHGCPKFSKFKQKTVAYYLCICCCRFLFGYLCIFTGTILSKGLYVHCV